MIFYQQVEQDKMIEQKEDVAVVLLLFYFMSFIEEQSELKVAAYSMDMTKDNALDSHMEVFSCLFLSIFILNEVFRNLFHYQQDDDNHTSEDIHKEDSSNEEAFHNHLNSSSFLDHFFHYFYTYLGHF